MPNPTFTQVTPHIFRLEVPFLVPVNVWLVQGADGWTVVDAGAPGSIRDELERLVIDQILAHTRGVKPTHLILTHGHLDHAAAAPRMRDLWRVMIAAGRAEVPYLTGSQRYYFLPSPNSPWHGWAQWLSSPALSGRSVQLPLDEGMTLNGFEVYAAPGHAPGQIALLHRADRALICGDVFMNPNNSLGDPYTVFTYDPVQNHASQAKLAGLDFDHLLVSHGPPILREGRAKAQAVVNGRKKK